MIVDARVYTVRVTSRVEDAYLLDATDGKQTQTRARPPPRLISLHAVPILTHAQTMDSWKNFQSSLTGLNIGQSANKFAKGFNSSVQATKERLGQVAPDEITELPQGVCPVCVRAIAMAADVVWTGVQSTRTSKPGSTPFATPTSPSSSTSPPPHPIYPHTN